MNWQVRLGYDVSLDGWRMFIFRDIANIREYMTASEHGFMLVHRIAENERMEPFIELLGFDGRDILSGIAGQLAQQGYGALDATPAQRVLERHMESLEKQAERLFTLANR